MFCISPKLSPYFKGFSFLAEIIMLSVYIKCQFSLSYRDLEEMMSIRGAKIDHATLQRWIIRFVPLIYKEVRKRKKQIDSSWRMNETYIKLNGKWIYLYKALDSLGNTVDFLLCIRRDKSAALAFFRKAFRENNLPKKVVINKSGSNIAALDNLNTEILEDYRIMIFQVKYLNNIVDRFIKKRIKPMLGFKSFHSQELPLQA